MKKGQKTILLSGLTIIAIMLSLMVIQASAVKPVETPPSISYGGDVYNGDGSYTLTYYVTSGDPVVKKWRLYSPCFKKWGPILTISAKDPSEPEFEPDWNLNPGQNYIEFKHDVDHPFTDGLTRTYKITLYMGTYYAGLTIGYVDYQLQWSPGTNIEGEIMGPICAPDLIIPETPLGTIGALIPLIAALGLVAASKKNLISIKVT